MDYRIDGRLIREEELANILYNSEDDFEEEDCSEVDGKWIPDEGDVQIIDDLLENNDPVNTSFLNAISDGGELNEKYEINSAYSTEDLKAFSALFSELEVNPNASEFTKAIWKKGNLVMDKKKLQFLGSSTFNPEMESCLSTPFQCFSFLFSNDIEEHIVNQTMLYAAQEDNMNFKIDTAELRCFIGIIYLMSVCILPGTRDYWGPLAPKVIIDSMTCNRFEKNQKFHSL